MGGRKQSGVGRCNPVPPIAPHNFCGTDGRAIYHYCLLPRMHVQQGYSNAFVSVCRQKEKMLQEGVYRHHTQCKTININILG